MLYLILAILSSAAVSLLMRFASRRGSSMSLLACNYVMCTLLSLLFTGGAAVDPAAPGLPLTLGLGVVNGALYLGGFVLLQWNVGRSGVVLPATFMKLGVLVPTILAITVFRETPRVTQLLGVAAAVAAILLLHEPGQDRGKAGLGGLILLMLCGGTADAMSKVYEQYGSPLLRNQFLLYTFLSALVMCLALCLIRRERITLADVGMGLMLGVPNYLSSRFLLLSLSSLPGVVAYPFFSVGTILMVAAAGMLLFREYPGRRKLLALSVILLSLVLLNL